jgi:endonuclease YncB( thermonuclease family)
MIRAGFFIVVLAATLIYAIAALGRTPEAVAYTWKVIRVVDGDTVQFEAPWIPAPIAQRISVRVYGVDTPEKGHRAQCPQEAIMGQRATDFTKNAIASASSVQVMLMDWDKYGGRVLGDIMINERSLRSSLIAEGLAREYFGEAKTSWCN